MNQNGNRPSDTPFLGDVVSLRTPVGPRFYRVQAATQERVRLKPLTPVQVDEVLRRYRAARVAATWAKAFENLGRGLYGAAWLISHGIGPKGDA